MSVMSVLCCQVEVSATSWSLVQRSPTDCGASLCVWSRKTSRMRRPWPALGRSVYVYVWLLWLRFFRAFPQLLGKCQGKTRKGGARPALFLIFVLYVLFVCKCVLYYCHRVDTQLQLTNISYHIISYHIS
jgi:hypothetical protein